MKSMPLYRRVLLARALQRAARRSMGAAARLALFRLLQQTGLSVPLVAIHTWSRDEQGRAYLWAIAFVAGAEDLPAPHHVVTSHTPAARRLAKGKSHARQDRSSAQTPARPAPRARRA